jgi:hypothetical protein
LRDLLVAVLLTNLEYLEELEGNIFEGLPRNLQRQIEDQTEFNLYIIEPETPTVVKFMIFSRVNTDGLVLTQPVGRQAYRPAPLHPSH